MRMATCVQCMVAHDGLATIYQVWEHLESQCRAELVVQSLDLERLHFFWVGATPVCEHVYAVHLKLSYQAKHGCRGAEEA